MKTKIFTMNGQNDEAYIKEAAALLRAGEVVAFPTETVYGLGADATNKAAIAKIFQAKGRPSDNPLIVHVATKGQLNELVQVYPSYVDTLITTFSPGPITYVLKRKNNVATNVTAKLDTVGIRIPNNDVALRLLKEVDLPIAAPSANMSGRPSPTKASHVYDDLNGKIAAIVDAMEAEVGVESTVIDCTGDVPLILRVGAITKEAIEAVVGEVRTLSKKEKTEKPKSPGLKYKHYAPEVPLILVENNALLQEIVDRYEAEGNRVGVIVTKKMAENIEAAHKIVIGNKDVEIAQMLYDTLRSLKKDQLDVVVSQSFSVEGVGLAIMDRLTRAATEIVYK
ncbi:MAG TPA: threonylcarbamoyl-AMP synthase [Candidatus Pseudogracilibacillus intestinigallinarum]|uniref:Threonylcarbamoyl-AMP synthase n=1 Tax=Candidatus Pseudogracilibacillus intestinigallinarum TaxID=2838742 RepID=A0A9D1TLE5_9BACI|nr:threonylcarbamoyl-AMP synthase [Candidatus Pseudogracilibacillus intestinigallinarum]